MLVLMVDTGRRTHGEDVSPLHKCRTSILSITANSARAGATHQGEAGARWTRPVPRQLKINVDASFHEDVHEGAIGVVIRDFQVTFVAAKNYFLPYVASASMAEALAMKDGLSLAASKVAIIF